MTDAMHWSPDPPVRPEPLLRIDLSGHSNDPITGRRIVEDAVAEWCRTGADDAGQDPIG